MLRSIGDPAAEHPRIIKSTLLKRIDQPKELAGVICFMLSDNVSNMTGSIDVVDGLTLI